MQKIILIVIVIIVLAAIGVFYFLSSKEKAVEETPASILPDLGNLAPEVDVGPIIENPLQDMPSTNPLEDVPNPFEGGYENPFSE